MAGVNLSRFTTENTYDYVVNIARYADANDFKAVWVPERL